MKTPEREIFFVGYAKALPPGLKRFLPAVALVLVAAFAGLGWAVSATSRDPGAGAFRWDWQRQTVTGVLRTEPTPTITLTEASERYPEGRTLMLSSLNGKRGVQGQAEGLDGRLVTASGIALKRGELDMLALRGGTDGLATAEGDGAPPAIAPVTDEPLGRWRITGEICDGKCLAGAMRPGTGLAHKACANLCLIGGVPAVMVATGPVEGSEFLLVAGPDGGPMPEALRHRVGELVTLEGEVVRRSDLLILHADPDSVRRP